MNHCSEYEILLTVVYQYYACFIDVVSLSLSDTFCYTAVRTLENFVNRVIKFSEIKFGHEGI